MISRTRAILLALSFLSLPLIQAQFVSSLPQCVQDCITQSQDDNCQSTDIKCLCRASAGNFLPDLITCIHSNCDNDLDNDLLLTPLQLACQLAGVPIPAAALRNAENEASSLASQVTTTVTMSASSSSPEATTTVTVTSIGSGTTVYEIYPVTVFSTTTITGSTITRSLAPVLMTTTNSVGSTYTFWVSDPGPGTRTSLISITLASSVPVGSDTTTSMSVAAQETSSSLRSSLGSKTTKASDPAETDSAPFTNTNSGGVRMGGGSRVWVWVGMVVAVCLVWI
ncbi:uncharacterized protein LY89DRAFT_682270 [Mollisia scopiformis]|uniref:CFEM domain-containing protein n=1 Tax=Mollisia scopiformis TaxID=149040 RepID=A0A194XK78_MOLSC|nr:uncharacterized protein LY89DRAFT_682270 [Mollisia scopiformis]KUJ20546.1 hypothetical protein LY89DRAFT_682270 [Mollisia scopiformis]